MKTPLFILILFLSCLKINAQEQSTDTIHYVPPAIFQDLMYQHPGSVLIDVRIWNKYKKKRIPGALSAINPDSLSAITDTLDTEQYILIYCGYSDRSSTASELLKEKGFKNIYILKGGLNSWKKAGNPIDKSRKGKSIFSIFK